MVLQLHDYPRMERQDLSQSQLQAFKFTPVDDPGLESRPGRAALQPVSPSQLVNGGWKDYPINSSSDLSSLNGSFEFANNSMPSLNEAPFGYGFTPVQSSLGAVSDSPKKKYIQASAQRIMQQSAKAFLNGGGPLAYGLDSLPSLRPDNTSSGALGAHNFDNSSYSHNTSLVQALKNEQEAHYQSKLALDAEKVQRLEAEAEVKKLVEHNKSLLNSIRLLQSTVKHMVTKEQEGEKNHAKANTQAAHTESKCIQEKERSTSILYDSLSQQRHLAEQQRQKDLTEASAASLIELELPGKFPSVKKTEEIHRQQVPSTKVVESPPSPGCRSPADRGENLIQPQPVLSSGNLTQQLHLPTPVHVSQPYVVANDPGQMLRDSSAPMLQLPASFLAKYGGPRRTSSSRSLSSDSDQSDVPSQRTNLTVLQGYKGVSTTVTPSRNMPSAEHLDWKLRQDELDDFLNAPRYTWPNSKESWYFKYPLRYLPRITEKNVYRTVMIDFIPHGTTYSNVLSQIRGGVLESVQMYGVGRGSSEFICARVVFTHEASAAELHERGQQPGIFMNGHRVRVWQVSEPTYPRSQLLENLIYEEAYTRLLIVDAALVDMEHVLRLKLRHQISGGFVLDISSTQDGMTLVEFTSIAESEKALKTLIADPDLDDTQFDFEPDYCARPYDEL